MTQPEQERPFEDQLTDAVQSLEGIREGIYERDAMLTTFSGVTQLAQQGFESGELEQPKTIEIKIAATRTAKEIAEANGDTVTAVALGQQEETLVTLLSVLQPKEAEPEPATTTVAGSGSAKTS